MQILSKACSLLNFETGNFRIAFVVCLPFNFLIPKFLYLTKPITFAPCQSQTTNNKPQTSALFLWVPQILP